MESQSNADRHNASVRKYCMNGTRKQLDNDLIFRSHVQEMVPQIHVEHEMPEQANPTYSTSIAKITIHKSNNYSTC